MKRFLYIITTFICLGTALHGACQGKGKLIPKVLNRLTLSYDMNVLYPKDLDNVYFNGAALGYDIDFKVSRRAPLYIGTGVNLHFVVRNKTYYQDEQYNLINIKQTTTFFNANVPVDLIYRFPVMPSFTLSPFVGLNFRIQIIGRNKNRIKAGADDSQLNEILDRMELGPANGNLFSKKDYGSAHLNRFQMGWHIGVRGQYQRVSLQVSYGSDFVKLHKNLSSANLMVTLGYSI